ncbi:MULTISPECIES: cell division protein FtsZ [unclassified Flavobacterium]|uniref:cell division protein FtsZ n=1 Tax=unclassified Flavobacterium TaxID=196869 RepID=UPI0008684E19|nr:MULTISPECIES: cell division protein FtsZ [unclassified Flavobacterium]MBN9284022.1 cell division protein FtsZ [Flavobacterium sp.]ODS81540.1 MAG: cell division protein FtsZ [Chryseobacterium sp. SCN 40-13]OJV73329.1 MAG: cell division protein FtsZ [Flavobacterium sp. 40-81]
MNSNSEFGSISFDLPKNQSNVIKVIGVGGGGSNAINHMFKQGIKGVDFVVCNTDSQALQSSSVPNKIQLGVSLTEGLGAGANPEVGQQSALESIEEIEKMLDTNTKMVFITAGMGGGTGTGAAPVIAQLSKERDILTVGIVTIPFQFEGKVRQEQALLGVERLRKQVDSLIVINNNKLREVYGNLGFKAGFSKADEVLATASRGIAEVITHHYTQNIDLKDAKTVLSNSGTAIMGSAMASGETRAKDAIVDALDSPLLNDNKITGAKNVLLLIVSGTNEITIDEIGEINDHIQMEAGHNANIIMGVGEDESLGDAIAVTIIATGFNVEQQADIVNTEPKKIIHTLEGEQKMVQDLTSKPFLPSFDFSSPIERENAQTILAEATSQLPVEEKIVFSLEEETTEVFEKKEPIAAVIEEELPTADFINNLDVFFEIVSPVKEEAPVVAAPVMRDVREIEVFEPQFVVPKTEEQITFSFDLPISNTAAFHQERVSYELSNETKEIKVNQPVQVVPVTEVNKSGVVKYSLEDYMEKENELITSKPVAEIKEEPIAEELNFTMKKVEPVAPNTSFDEISPVEMTIEETLRMRAEERKRKMKEFNYKFNNSASRVNELEKEPAYKRMGVDLNSAPVDNSKSRMSLGMDSNDDLQLRSNNSFLHDNVD